MEMISKVNCSLCYALVFVRSNWKLLHFATKEDNIDVSSQMKCTAHES